VITPALFRRDGCGVKVVTENEASQFTVVEHLGELRRRLFFCLIAIFCTTVLAFCYSKHIIKLLLLPAGGMHLIALDLMDGFLIRWRITLYSGLCLAFPIWAYQIYRFVRPALHPHERKGLYPLLFGSIALFCAGTAFGYYLLWGMIRVLKGLFPADITYLPAADSYIAFVVFFLLLSGIIFLFPMVLLGLVKFGLLTTETMRRQRKIAYFALFAIAEIITPVADPIVAPLTFMVPLVLLYEASILLGRREERRVKGEERRISDPPGFYT
jgi:sec-independent protein translocase protein TatC